MTVCEVTAKTMWEWLVELFWSPGVDYPKTRRFWIRDIPDMSMESRVELVETLIEDGRLPEMASEHPSVSGLYAVTMGCRPLDDHSLDVVYTYGAVDPENVMPDDGE